MDHIREFVRRYVQVMGRIRKGEDEFSETYDVPVAIDASNIEALTQSTEGNTTFAEMYSGNVHELVGDLEENLHLLRNVLPPNVHMRQDDADRQPSD